jgi:SAM-dependent methyltransferase
MTSATSLLGRLAWLAGRRPGADAPALELLRPVGLLEKGQPFRCRLRVLPGALADSPGGPLFLSARWLSHRGEPLPLPASSLPLPGCWPWRRTLTIRPRLNAPDALGDFLLEWALYRHTPAGLAEAGLPAVTMPCHVTSRSAEDFDYRRLYARRDLRRDYWSVVGPATEEEYRRLGLVKRQLLIDLGLRPDSRILDVGCGTGLLTAALADFLDDSGLYHGTDLAAEAVAFCKDRYRRPNFFFAQNALTALPPGDVRFDFIVFYSVFTHTFPAETAALLREARRRLAEGGILFADLFASPLVKSFAGNRGAVEVNRDYFLALVASCGLHAELVMAQPWQRFGERLFFKFTAGADG